MKSAPGRSLLQFFILFISCLVIYWNGRYDFPRADQLTVLAESVSFPDPVDWFLHLVSYNRLRTVGQGDYFLFRPGTHAVLALTDLFLRNKPLLAGLLSIGFMAFAATSLLGEVNRRVGLALSWALALFYASQLAGFEIVAWRHISPYLLSCALTLFAIPLLERRGPWGGCLLFLATLFHESVVFGGAVFVAAGSVLWLAGHRHLRRPILVVAGTLALYFTLNVADYLVTAPPGLLGTHNRPANLTTLLHAATITVEFFAATARATFLFPTVDFSAPSDVFDLVRWKFGEAPWLNLLGGTIGLAVMAGAWPAIRKGDVPAMFLAGMVISIAFALGFGRGLRETPYIDGAPYYFALSSAYWVALSSFPLSRLRLPSSHLRSGRTPPEWTASVWGLGPVGAVILLAAGVQSALTHLAVTRNYPAGVPELDRVVAAAAAVFARTGQCYGGVTPGADPIYDVVAVYFDPCRDGETPALLDRIPAKGWALRPLRLRSDLGVAVAMEPNAEYTQIDGHYRAARAAGFLLSADSFASPAVSTEVTGLRFGGLVVNYSPGNFARFGYTHGTAFVEIVADGASRGWRNVRPVMNVGPSPTRLAVVPQGDRMLFLVNGVVATFAAMAEMPKAGRIGVFSQADGREQLFTPPAVGTAGGDPFEPAAALPLLPES